MNNLEMMRKRLEFQGGIRQEDRMIKGKWWTLQRALNYSYQGCDTQLIQLSSQVIPLEPKPEDDFGMPIHAIVRALINPDKLKQDYDDKILSVNYEHSYNTGDIFEWKGTSTQWLIYDQELTEDAYFRGSIRRCRYKINFLDSKGYKVYTYAAIRGPVETQINSIQKNQVRVDQANHTLNILLPLNEVTSYAFKRYSEFLLNGKCWKVQTVDSMSLPNILEITAEEDYINRDTDDTILEVKDGLIIEPIDEDIEFEIQGEGFIKPQIPEAYTVEETGGTWSILEEHAPVRLCESGTHEVTVTWEKIVSGQFTLVWTKGDTVFTRTIVVESLF